MNAEKTNHENGNDGKTVLADNSLPRLFVAENQEFIIEGTIFTWHFSNPELRQGITLNRKGQIEPQILSVTIADNG
jgi:hypothetical protein